MLFAITKPFTYLIVQFDDRVLEAIARGNLSNYSMLVTANKPLLKQECGSSKYDEQECVYLFRLIDFLPEKLIGFILIAVALVLISLCLVGLKRSLNLIFDEEKAIKVRESIDKDLPGCFKHLTGPMFIIVRKIFMRCFFID